MLVLLSTYNGEKYLGEQLSSIEAQKDVKVDILIRDDGSTDNTNLILKSSESSRVSVIYGKNIGACKSYIELIDKAPINYDYYAFCDQDDVWLEDKLYSAIEKLVNADENRPALYYSGQTLIDQNEKKLHIHEIDASRSQFGNFIFNQMAGCTAVFNTVLMSYLKKYKPDNIFSHDAWCYKLCFALNGDIYVDAESHILYRQHSDNTIGLGYSLNDKFKRATKYVFKYNASSYAKEILQGYKDVISNEKIEFITEISNANVNMFIRMKLLRDNRIYFNSYILRVLFIIKVCSKNL